MEEVCLWAEEAELVNARGGVVLCGGGKRRSVSGLKWNARLEYKCISCDEEGFVIMGSLFAYEKKKKKW